MLGTPLQEIYDAFFIKSVKNWLYKEDQVFQFFKTSCGKSYKTVRNILDYILYTNEKYITIYSEFDSDVDLTIKINDDTFIVPITTEDTKILIAQNIKAEIETKYNVDELFNLIYPRLLIIDNEEIKIEIGNDLSDITVSETYNGEMIAKLGQDEIDLIAMFMLLESYYKQKSSLEATKQHVGTKDFNKLPNKEAEYKNVLQSIKDLKEEIYLFRQEFYTYKN